MANTHLCVSREKTLQSFLAANNSGWPVSVEICKKGNQRAMPNRLEEMTHTGLIGSSTLVLVPTAMELGRIDAFGGFPNDLASCAVCGFGVVAAAARTAQILAEIRPARVLLIGIAGTFEPDTVAVGSALEFSSVAIEGIGVGEGERLMPTAQLGFPQWPGEKPIFDRLELSAPDSIDAELLTVCAAAIDVSHAASRKQRFAAAKAEDMEGFAVALACALYACPLRIIRGISNVVGDRESKRWRISEALAAARNMALTIIHSDSE
jgi:futalosine hydrolase